MFGFGVKIIDQLTRVKVAADRAAFKNVGHAISRVRKDAIASIAPAEGPSEPGRPPHTRPRVSKKTGKQLKGQIQRAIVFHHDKAKQSAMSGPRFSVLGTSGKAHELGGEFRGDVYPKRPFMWPAVEQNMDRFARDWQGSIGE